MAILNHKIDYSKPRKVIEDITINHYTKEQKQEMLDMIKELTKINTEGENIQIVPKKEESDIKLIRYMFINLTNKTDEILEMKKEDFKQLLLDGDFVIKQVLNEFETIARELMFEIKNETSNQLCEFANVIEQGEMMNKLQEIADKMGISVQDLIKLGNDNEKIEELKKLQEKPKKKRGRKKKVIE